MHFIPTFIFPSLNYYTAVVRKVVDNASKTPKCEKLKSFEIQNKFYKLILVLFIEHKPHYKLENRLDSIKREGLDPH